MSKPAYAEFGVQSNFSFLRGASKPEELVVAATMMGHSAIGLADRNTVAGVVRAWQQAKEAGIAYHPGCRLVFADGTPDILAYPQNRKGWGHLCRMLTQANENGEKGAPYLVREDFFEWGANISFAVLPLLEGEQEANLIFLNDARGAFGQAVRVAVAPLYHGNDRFRIEQAAALAHAARLSLMATNDVSYHVPERRSLQDIVTAIRLKTTVFKAGYALQANAERYLKPPLEMARLFRTHPQAIAETLRFAKSLKFSLKELKYYYPEESSGKSISPQAELERLTWEGAAWRYPNGVPEHIRDTIRKELKLISEKEYAPYFLTVHDIVQFARGEGILCQGRGSAANSTVCFCMRITEVDPDLIDVLFERFISTERDEPPDIDVDFEHERRDEVIAYIYKKYSEQRTALAAAVTTYRSRSAMREVAKALGFSDDTIDALASSTWRWTSEDLGKTEGQSAGLDMNVALTKQFFEHANALMGFPRHLTQHVGGFVITNDRLDEVVPIVKTGMDERRMVEWDKDDLDSVGILKVDVLALGMLSCLRRAFDLLHANYDARDEHGRPYELATIPKKEEAVYDMICRADTLGVFQIESRAQMSMLPRLKPRKFYDLVIEVAIVRPGPIQGDMVHPYLRRREGKEPVEYHSDVLKNILERTLGVPLFQEQAMKIAIDAGGFTPGEADQLRRAMATFKRTGTVGNYKQKMIDGMTDNGYPEEFAERCFKQIEGFGEYGFPESHAASFALLVYASSWFKAHYPDVFCAAILNSQPMGFYPPAQLVRDAQDHGLEIRAVDVNLSDWDCTLEKAEFDPSRISARHISMREVIHSKRAVRLGFRQIKGLSDKTMEAFVLNRGEGYESVRDVWLRSGLDVAAIEKLAQADAFRSIGLDRRAALWAVRALDGKTAAERLPLFDQTRTRLRDNEPETRLPIMPLGQHVIHDYGTLGLSLKAHPVSFLRERLEREGVTPNAALENIANGRRVTVAGLVLVRQRPGSAKGVIFMTLEDEKSIANIIVWKKTFERFRPIVLGARFVRICGKLQSQSGVIHIVAEKIEDLSSWLGSLTEAAQSIDPDFHSQANPKERGAMMETPARGRYEQLSRDTGRVMPKGRNFQ
jgi:error-prone DNA polymerase